MTAADVTLCFLLRDGDAGRKVLLGQKNRFCAIWREVHPRGPADLIDKTSGAATEVPVMEPTLAVSHAWTLPDYVPCRTRQGQRPHVKAKKTP